MSQPNHIVTWCHHLSCHLLPLLPLSRPLLLSASALLSRPRAAAARATAGALLLERCCVSAAAAVVLLLECCCWSAAARGHQRTFREDGWWPAGQPSSRTVLWCIIGARKCTRGPFARTPAGRRRGGAAQQVSSRMVLWCTFGRRKCRCRGSGSSSSVLAKGPLVHNRAPIMHQRTFHLDACWAAPPRRPRERSSGA